MIRRIRLFNHFLEGGRGVIVSWAILLLLAATGGYQLWRDWPRGKPATLLFVNAAAVGPDLLVSFALHKERDCALDREPDHGRALVSRGGRGLIGRPERRLGQAHPVPPAAGPAGRALCVPHER